MSTKIYNGVRVPLARLNEFLETISAITTTIAAADIYQMINSLTPEQSEAWIKESMAAKRYEQYSPKDKQMAKTRIAYRRLSEMFGRSADDLSMLNDYNKQAGWSLFVHKRFVYGWPWGEYVNQVVFKVGDIKWIEYFGYWNGSDKPAEVSSRDWKTREVIWKEILDAGEFAHRLNYATVDFKCGHRSIFTIRDLVIKLQEAAIETAEGEVQL